MCRLEFINELGVYIAEYDSNNEEPDCYIKDLEKKLKEKYILLDMKVASFISDIAFEWYNKYSGLCENPADYANFYYAVLDMYYEHFGLNKCIPWDEKME